jgi:RNA polymerase sigma-70 factor (ECF subfamily)
MGAGAVPIAGYESPNESGRYRPPEPVVRFLRELWQSICIQSAFIALEEFEQLLLQVAMRYRFGSSLAEPGVDEQVAFLRSLHAEELVLARACAAGNEAAWEKFIVQYRETIYHSAYAIAGSDSVGRELADSLYADMYGLRERDGVRYSPLLLYHGRGALAGWLRSVLAQRFVDLHRKTHREVSLEELAEPAVPQATAEASAPSERATSLIQQIIQMTLTRLPSDQRFILSEYYLDGRTLKQIASLLGVHESTVSRSLSKLTASLRKQIVGELRKTGISRREAEEIMEVDVRDLEVQVRKSLQGEAISTFQDQRALTVEGGDSDV